MYKFHIENSNRHLAGWVNKTTLLETNFSSFFSNKLEIVDCNNKKKT